MGFSGGDAGDLLRWYVNSEGGSYFVSVVVVASLSMNVVPGVVAVPPG